MFQRYLNSVTDPSFFVQTWTLLKRRLIQFIREPRMQILLVSPFITTIMIFLVINGLLNSIKGSNGGNMT